MFLRHHSGFWNATLETMLPERPPKLNVGCRIRELGALAWRRG